MGLKTIHNYFITRFLTFASVDCSWTDWSGWTQCSESCGPGNRTATRTQEYTYSTGMVKCDGDKTSLTENCKLRECEGTLIYNTNELQHIRPINFLIVPLIS